MRRKVGGGLLCPFQWEELGRHVTQCRLGWGLPRYRVLSWPIQPSSHAQRHGPRFILTQATDAGLNASVNRESGGGCCAPFRGELGPHLTQCDLPSGILIHPAVWPQQTWAAVYAGVNLCSISQWVKMHRCAEYLEQRSFCSKFIVQTHGDTHMHSGPTHYSDQ